jgi:hypothetical protein
MAEVTFEDIIGYYGSVEKARAALGLKSRQTLYNWKDSGVPDGQQCRIQIKTDGKLKADRDATGEPSMAAA